jgi:Ca-activated chloride channel family protein
MNMIIKNIVLILFICSSYLFAQRSEVNEGVDLYKKDKFADAEVNFKKGIEKSPENFEARFNLGDAYYKQGRFDEANQEFHTSLELTDDPTLKAKVHHNIGNSLLKAQKIKESIDAYKNALKLNPNDMETKYNLSYALSMLDKQQNQQQQNNQNQQNQDQNKDKNQDQNKDQNQDQQNQNDRQQNDQNKPPQNEQAQQDQLKNKQDQISKEEAERILQALKNNEQDIQKKLRRKTGAVIKREKDW